MSDLSEIQLSDRANEIAQLSALVKAKSILDPGAKIVIEGVVHANTWWIAADEIIFKPGSKLIFPLSVTSVSRDVYIVAEKITVEDALNPALITWDKTTDTPPPDRGQASAGSGGSGEGATGGRGGDGAPGTTGSIGREAPNLTILLRTLAVGTLSLDLSGAPGAQGGTGQRGGSGGSGATGSSAQQGRKGGPFGTTIWLPYCEAGPGQGGRGGDGGTGGIGGTGGNGGRGGSVTIVSIPEALPVFTNALLIDTDGGRRGPGGIGGTGGDPGAGGAEGQLASFCNSAGRNGIAGSLGATGIDGSDGEDGNPGRAFVGMLTEDQFVALFGF